LRKLFAELSDAAELNASVAGSDHGGRPVPGGLSHQQAAALNYSTLVGAAAAAAGGVVDPSSNISSTETLLRNIQGLLKVAADNARQQERQINYEKGRTQSHFNYLINFKWLRILVKQ